MTSSTETTQPTSVQSVRPWSPQLEALVAAVAESHQGPLIRALLAWAAHVEEWLLEPCAGRCPQPRAEPAPEVSSAPAGEACRRCGKPVTAKRRLRSCAPCSTAWLVPEKRAPLAQSSWVPDAEEQLGPPEQTVTERIRELEAKVSEQATMIARRDAEVSSLRGVNETRNFTARDARVRELEAEVERLKAANATQAPAERSDNGQLVVLRVRALMTMASMRSPDVVFEAAQLLRALSDCSKAERIEFSVKEVLP